MSGVESLHDANSEKEGNEDEGNNHDPDAAGMDCSVTSLRNFVRSLQEPRAVENVDESTNQNKSQDITSRDTQGVQVDAEIVEKSSSQNLTPENTRRNTTRAQPSVNAENVFDSPSSSRIQRYTSTGGIRNTPRRN